MISSKGISFVVVIRTKSRNRAREKLAKRRSNRKTKLEDTEELN